MTQIEELHTEIRRLVAQSKATRQHAANTIALMNGHHV